jgi:hypothetical protein
MEGGNRAWRLSASSPKPAAISSSALAPATRPAATRRPDSTGLPPRPAAVALAGGGGSLTDRRLPLESSAAQGFQRFMAAMVRPERPEIVTAA